MNSKIFRYAVSSLINEILIQYGIRIGHCINKPEVITLNVTDKCNARCTTCDIWRSNVDEKNELTIQEWKNLLLDLSRWIKPCFVTFTGGEPFRKEGFLELLEYAHSLGIYSSVTTNGAFFDEAMCERVLSTGVDSIEFSLNSAEPAFHDQSKGIEGLHGKIVHAIQFIKERNSAITIAVCFVITNENYASLDYFISWAADIGIDLINLQLVKNNLQPSDKRPLSIPVSPDNPDLKIGNLELLDSEIDKVLKKKKEGYPIAASADYILSAKTYFRNPLLVPRNPFCDIGFRRMFVMPGGDVYFCSAKNCIGNIKKIPIKHIWYSSAACISRKNLMPCRDICVSICTRKMNLKEKYFHFLVKSGICRRKIKSSDSPL